MLSGRETLLLIYHSFSSKETAVFEKLNLLSLIISGQGTIEKRIDLTEDSLFSTGTSIELTLYQMKIGSLSRMDRRYNFYRKSSPNHN